MAKKKSRKKAKTKRKVKSGSKKRVTKTKRRVSKPKAAKPRPAKAKSASAPAAPAAPAASIKALPDVEVTTTGGGRLRLSSLRGKNVVLYFYPKDDTPGCTMEGCDIRDRYGEFQRLDTVVLGVSRDNMNSHEQFKAKFNFPFELVTDSDEKLCRAFDVIREKMNYGKTYMGVDRSTFLFDKSGALRKEMRGVSVPGHVDQILDEIRRF